MVDIAEAERWVGCPDKEFWDDMSTHCNPAADSLPFKCGKEQVQFHAVDSLNLISI